MFLMMPYFLLIKFAFMAYIISVFSFTGTNDVLQPDVVWATVGQSHTIHCSQTKGLGYNRMYWFRQIHGGNMELIVYTTLSGSVEFGKFNQSKFSVFKAEPESGSLTVKDMDSKDSAVYFCAFSTVL